MLRHGTIISVLFTAFSLLFASCNTNAGNGARRYVADTATVKAVLLSRDTGEIKRIMKACGVLRERDQRWRTKYGRRFVEGKMEKNAALDIIESMNRDDSLNMLFLKGITDRYGWPPVYCIGPQCENTLFLVLQHAQLNYQIEMFPLIVQAAYHKDCPRSDVAYLLDRILIKKSRKQYFGTQLIYDASSSKYIIYPLQYPLMVNELRRKADLQPLEEYLTKFNS